MPPEKAIIEQAVHNHDLPWHVLFYYALASVTGGAAGCAIAGALKAKGIKITRWIVLSYAAIGMFASALFTAYFRSIGWITLNVEDVIIHGGASALIVVGLVSGINVSLHFGAKRFAKDSTRIAGVQIKVNDE